MTQYFKRYTAHYRSLLTMGVPIMVGQLGVILTGFVDNIMVGHHMTEELSAASFVNNIFMLPLMESEGRYRVSIAIGCTGGQHRSVAITRALAEFIRQKGYNASESHRDMTRKKI